MGIQGSFRFTLSHINNKYENRTLAGKKKSKTDSEIKIVLMRVIINWSLADDKNVQHIDKAYIFP